MKHPLEDLYNLRNDVREYNLQPEDVCAAGELYDSLKEGTHYIRNEQAFRDMGWHEEADKVKPLADEERARLSSRINLNE